MPLLNALGFTANKLTVSYQGSAKPQELTFEFKLKKKPKLAKAALDMTMLVNAIKSGLAGSDVFAPEIGDASVKGKPLFGQPGKPPPPELFGPAYKYTIEVRGVAPIFLRLAVEVLRASGADVEVEKMHIAGSIPPDGSELSATEASVRAWLEDRSAYPKRWPKLAFPVEVEDVGAKGISARVSFAKEVPQNLKFPIQDRLLGWNTLVVNYVGPDGEFVPQKLGPTMPKYAFTKREMTMSIDLFENTRAPAGDLLVNALQSIHHHVLPIQAVTLKL